MIKKHPVLTIVVAGLLFLIAVIAIWRISLRSANNNRLRAIAARGEPVDLAALDKFYATVPDSSNAALVWLKGAAAIMTGSDDGLRNFSFRWNMPLSPDQLQSGTEVLSANKEALALFRAAAALPGSRYPLVLSQYPVTNIQHLADIKSAAQLLRLQTLVAAQQGESRESAEAITRIFAAARSLETEPLLLSQLVRFALDMIAAQSLQCALNRTFFLDVELAEIQAAASRADDHKSLRLAMLGERASFITFVRDPQKALAPGPPIAPTGVEGAIAEVFLWPMARAVGFWQRDLRFGIDALTTNILFASMPSPQRFYSATNSEAIAEQAASGRYILTALLLPALQKAFQRDALHSAHIRNAVVALAVERFRIANTGKLPDSISALVPEYLREVPIDPYDGKPVRCKRTEFGYVVYCIGPDEKDDGGLQRPVKSKEKDPWDVTFIVERPAPKPKEAND
jgi:hypothetical protein